MKPPYIEGFDFDAVLHVLRNLRSQDQVEAFDLVAFEDAPTLAAAYVFQRASFLRFFTIRKSALNRACAICGISVTSPGMASAHMLCTPDITRDIGRYLARRIKSELPIVMAEAGIHRVDCACLATNRDAHAFLHYAGAQVECVLPKFGKSAETYFKYSWITGETQCVV